MWGRLKEPAPEIDEYGTQRWFNKDGKLHRENDLPARIRTHCGKSWWKNGKRHRDNDLPAIIWHSGDKEWWVNGEYIRRGYDNPLTKSK